MVLKSLNGFPLLGCGGQTLVYQNHIEAVSSNFYFLSLSVVKAKTTPLSDNTFRFVARFKDATH
jgi:hypothetical protein